MSLQPHHRDLLVRMGVDLASGKDQTVLVPLHGVNVRMVDGPEGMVYVINVDEERRMWREALERMKRMPVFLPDDGNTYFYRLPIPAEQPDPALARWEDDGGPPAPQPRHRTVWKSPALGFSALSIIP